MGFSGRPSFDTASMELLGIYLIAQHNETLYQQLPGYGDQRLLGVASFYHSMKKGSQPFVSV
jgi:hypothetical protein